MNGGDPAGKDTRRNTIEPRPWTYWLAGRPPNFVESAAVPLAARNVPGAMSEAPSEPSATFAEDTALSASFCEVTALSESFCEVTALSESFCVLTALVASFCVVTALLASFWLVTAPSARLRFVTARLASFWLVTAPLRSLALVIAWFLICDVPIPLTATAVPPSATNNATAEITSEACDELILRIRSSSDPFANP